MRIVSLLPSATEFVYALGLEDMLVGVSADCDYPPQVREKPVVSVSTLPQAAVEKGLDAAAIDRAVAEKVARGEPLYRVKEETVRELRPDLILAQDLCRVCAVPSGHVTDALEMLGVSSEVLSLDPHSVTEVVDCGRRVAEAAGRPQAGRLLADDLQRRLDNVAARARDTAPVRMLALEWPDPPFSAGHWVPEMIRVAGAEDVLGRPGMPSRRVTWEDVRRSKPDKVVYMPCGYSLPEASEQLGKLVAGGLLDPVPAAGTGEIYAVDASSYFSRPGPRMVDGVEILAWIADPAAHPEPPPGRVSRVGAR